MTDHDQFFKNLLREFFADLVHLAAPDFADRLRLDEPVFLESEHFTSFPEGDRRRLDIVARVSSEEGEPEVLLIHVEVEGQARKAMARRLMDYSLQLWLRHHEPVVPIVLYLRGGKPNVTRETLRLDVFGQSFLDFSYLAFGLSRSRAADYLKCPEPLAWGLAGLMRRGRMSPARHKLSCLEPIAGADLTDRQRYLLTNCVETYIEWDEADQDEFERLVAAEGKDDVATMETTWADRIRQEGWREGEQEGQRELLLAQLERRFGPLPETTRKRVASITAPERLSTLATDLLDAESLDELGL